MGNFFIDLGITASLFFPLFLFTFSVLWRLRYKGSYTVLLGFFFEAVLLRLGFAIAPQALNYHHSVGMSPVETGIAMGCGMPMVFMAVYHLAERKKRSQAAKEPLSEA